MSNWGKTLLFNLGSNILISQTIFNLLISSRPTKSPDGKSRRAWVSPNQNHDTKVFFHWWLYKCKKSKTLIPSRDIDDQGILQCDWQSLAVILWFVIWNSMHQVIMYHSLCTIYDLAIPPNQKRHPSMSREVSVWLDTPDPAQPKKYSQSQSSDLQYFWYTEYLFSFLFSAIAKPPGNAILVIFFFSSCYLYVHDFK